MQKGKTYRDRVGRAVRAIAGGCLVIHAAVAARGAGASDAWERGMGGVSFPRRVHPAAGMRCSEYILAEISAENPYSIPGLYGSSIAVSVVRRSWSSGLCWERTACSGYSHDILDASASYAAPGRFLHLHIITAVDRRRVTGYGDRMILSLRCAISFELSEILALELERGALSSGRDRTGSGYQATGRVGSGSVSVAMTVCEDGGSRRILRIGGSVRVAGSVSMLAGYRFDTGEVTGGLAVNDATGAAVSWGCHPALGCTFSVSLGAIR